MENPIEPFTTMDEVDRRFEQVAVLGHGGFGSVFLAKKKSGRQVALKFMRIGLDDEDEEIHSDFIREVDAVLKLDCTSDNKDMNIVYFRDWFRGANFACIVQQYADGGTLAQEIDRKRAENQPYTERRIAWYALQLSEALAHAHSRGVHHYDVKSCNILIDASAGGKLLLADFGSAVSPGEEGITFTELYASPELHVSSEVEDFTGLDPEKIDAFSLGCVLFELVCGKRLVDFEGDLTLSQFVSQQQNAEAVLNLNDVRLPWLPPVEAAVHHSQVGYSFELGSLIKSLLEPLPSNRNTPTGVQKPLRQSEQSPLLREFCSAAIQPQPGAALTVDNVQLGIFVQRGRDWHDGEDDGGVGSVGVVIGLDPDAQYTEVAFPSRTHEDPKPMCCRIGAGNKFELQVGPVPMKDFYAGSPNPRMGGLIYSSDASQHHVGQMVNNDCTVAFVNPARSIFIVTTMEKIHNIPTLPIAAPCRASLSVLGPRKPMPIPDTWNTDLGRLVPLDAGEERQMIIDAFFAPNGGMDIQLHEIVSIHAVQSVQLWDAYARRCEDVALQNWSNPNEKRLFHGTGRQAPELLLTGATFGPFYQTCRTVTNTNDIVFSEAACFGDRFAYRDGDVKKIMLSRVALGRVDERCKGNRPPRPAHTLEHHSVHKDCELGTGATSVYSTNNPCQVYPEFIIAYKTVQLPGRRIVRARRPSEENRRRRRDRSNRVPPRPNQLRSPTEANSSAKTSFVAQSTGRQSDAAVLQGKSASQSASAPLAASAGNDMGAEGSATKMCVVCMERPVCKVLLPCGHIDLCDICSTEQGIKKLKGKCPTCRRKIQQVHRVYL